MDRKQGLIIIAVLLVLRFVVVPWHQWLSDGLQQRDEFAQRLERLERIQQRQTGAEEKLVELKRQREQMEQSLLTVSSTADATVQILRRVEQLAGEQGVDLRNKDVGELVAGELPLIPVTIYVGGDALAMTRFVQALETGKPRVVVTDAALNNPRGIFGDINAIFQLAVPVRIAEVAP